MAIHIKARLCDLCNQPREPGWSICAEHIAINERLAEKRQKARDDERARGDYLNDMAKDR